jgi:hypothetical protein
MEKKKKTWTEPTLTVLVRRKPEEGILRECKGGEVDGPGRSAGLCAQRAMMCPQCRELAST